MIKGFFREIGDMWSDGWMEKILVLCMVAVVLLLISLPFIIYYDRVEMAAQHCVRTDQNRESTYIQYIYGDKGQLMGAYPVTTTEYLYTCDDYPRWR